MIGKEDNEDEDVSDIHKVWNSLEDEFLLFDRIPSEDRPCSSSDLCAFVYLDKKFQDEKNRMVSGAGHEQIWLRIKEEQIATLTEADVLYLTRCGVFHEDDTDSLSMFV